MRPRPDGRFGLWLLVSGIGLLAALSSSTFGALTSTTDNPGNGVTAASDFRAPTAGATVIAKTVGYVPGYVRLSGTYYVYANVTDSGNPASGIASVTADVSNLTAAETAVPLVAGSYSVGGQSYGYRSASLTALNSLTEGSKNYTLTLTDNAANSGTANGTVIVDNTAPAASDVQGTNSGGGIVGRAQISDTLTLTFNDTMEPNSIISGWDGSSTNVVVRLINGLILLGNDGIQIWNSADSAQLPLGEVDLGRGDYVGGILGGEIGRFGATGTASTMTLSNGTLTIVLGTASGEAATTAGANGTASWAPSSTATDRAGNGSTIASANESGSSDKEF